MKDKRAGTRLSNAKAPDDAGASHTEYAFLMRCHRAFLNSLVFGARRFAAKNELVNCLRSPRPSLSSLRRSPTLACAKAFRSRRRRSASTAFCSSRARRIARHRSWNCRSASGSSSRSRTARFAASNCQPAAMGLPDDESVIANSARCIFRSSPPTLNFVSSQCAMKCSR